MSIDEHGINQHTNQSIQLPEYERIDAKMVRGLINEETGKVRSEVKEEIQKQVESVAISQMTIFGIFASILAFLTIEFQLLKTLQNAKAILGFSLVLFALLISFNIALDCIAKNRLSNKNWDLVVFCVIIVGAAGGGIFLLMLGDY